MHNDIRCRFGLSVFMAIYHILYLFCVLKVWYQKFAYMYVKCVAKVLPVAKILSDA